MRLTIRTSLAMRTLMFCAVNRGRVVRKQDVAAACDASENHLAQVIHKLAQAGFVTTIRGRTGGLQLTRDPADLRVGEIVRCFEGTVPLTECMEQNNGNCPLAGCCLLKCAFAEALDAFYASLNRVTLADLVDGNADMQRLLTVA